MFALKVHEHCKQSVLLYNGFYTCNSLQRRGTPGIKTVLEVEAKILLNYVNPCFVRQEPAFEKCHFNGNDIAVSAKHDITSLLCTCTEREHCPNMDVLWDCLHYYG